MIGSDRAIARAHTRFASVDKSRSAVWTNERPRHAFRLGCERGRQWTKSAMRERTHRSRASINRAPLSGRTSDQDTLFVLGAREEDSGQKSAMRERTHRSRASINRAPLSGRTSDQDTLFVLGAR